MAYKDEINRITGISKELLPRGYQEIGGIIILNLRPEIQEKALEIARATKELYPRTKTICLKTGEITGEFRKPHIKKIIGEETQTTHTENGIKYMFDVTKIMFAKGNVNERKRIAELIKKDETIIDMFSGIGYFSLGMGKIGTARIYSIEKNPEAYKYLVKNIELNKITTITPILGDCEEEMEKLGVMADRIVMGLIPKPKKQLKTALKYIKNNGIIHYEGTEPAETLYQDLLEEAIKQGIKTELTRTTIVKSYAPKKQHIVIDVKVRK